MRVIWELVTIVHDHRESSKQGQRESEREIGHTTYCYLQNKDNLRLDTFQKLGLGTREGNNVGLQKCAH